MTEVNISVSVKLSNENIQMLRRDYSYFINYMKQFCITSKLYHDILLELFNYNELEYTTIMYICNGFINTMKSSNANCVYPRWKDIMYLYTHGNVSMIINDFVDKCVFSNHVNNDEYSLVCQYLDALQIVSEQNIKNNQKFN